MCTRIVMYDIIMEIVEDVIDALLLLSRSSIILGKSGEVMHKGIV